MGDEGSNVETPTGAEQPPGSREVVRRLEEAGFEPGTALRALVSEARYTAAIRFGDMHQAPETPAAEAAAIKQAERFGLPNNKEELRPVKSALEDLESAFLEKSK